MRKLVYAAAAFAFLAFAGAAALGFYLDPILKKAVETFGPRVAGVPVRLGSVSVSPFTGRLSLEGLVVGNPPGFKTPSAFELGTVRVSVAPRSLLGGRIEVREVAVRGAAATYELGPGGSNVAVIERRAASASSAPPEPARKAGAARRVVIRDFRFEGGKVRVSAAFMGGKALELPIPDVHLKDIGGERGTTPARAGAEMLAAVTSAAEKAALAGARSLGQGVQRAARLVSGLRGLFK